jgi:hypothetical protein
MQLCALLASVLVILLEDAESLLVKHSLASEDVIYQKFGISVPYLDFVTPVIFHNLRHILEHDEGILFLTS